MGIKDLIARVRGDSVTVGIDIGHSSIKLARILHSGGQRILQASGLQPLESGVVMDNDIRDEKALKNSIELLLQSTCPDGIGGDLVVGINWSNGVIADTLHMELPPDQNEEEAILAQATSRSPFDEDGIVLDHEVLHRKEKFADVLVVAAKSVMLERWARLFHEMNLKPVAMDVDAFAVSNVYLELVPRPADPAEIKPVGILVIGDKKSHISFIKEGRYHSTREIQNSAVNQIAHVVCRHLGVNAETAGAYLRGEKKDGFNPEMLQAAVDFAAEDLARGVEQAIQYYESSEKQEEVSALFVAGGGAVIPGVIEGLGTKLNRTVQTLDPLQYLPRQAHLWPDMKPPVTHSNLMAVAIGLAMRKF